MENQTQNQNQLEIININQVSESWKAVNQAMNQACKNGVYTLDEAYILKTALMNLDKAVKTLDSHQQFIVKMSEQTKKPKVPEAPVEPPKPVGEAKRRNSVRFKDQNDEDFVE